METNRVVELFLGILQPELAHKGPLSSVAATQLLHKAYLTRYGLATAQELEQHPASLVRMRPAEDGFMGTVLEDHFDHFLDLEIYNYMTWFDYISLPRHELHMVRKKAEKRKRMKVSAEGAAASDVEAALRGMKGQ